MTFQRNLPNLPSSRIEEGERAASVTNYHCGVSGVIADVVRVAAESHRVLKLKSPRIEHLRRTVLGVGDKQAVRRGMVKDALRFGKIADGPEPFIRVHIENFQGVVAKSRH